MMEITEMKPLLPLDFSLNVKTEVNSNLSMKNDVSSALLSPEKGSSSAFKVVTPKNSDGKFNIFGCVRKKGELTRTWIRMM